MRIAFAISRASSVDESWTTVHLARAALDRGDHVRFVEPWDFEIEESGRVVARSHAFDTPTSSDEIAIRLVERSAVRRHVDLENVDLLMIRASPLDLAVLTFATLARERGVQVVNDPLHVVRVSHKGWLATLPGVRTPQSIVTRNRGSCDVFHQAQTDGIVLKPARGSGGRKVSFVAPNDSEGLDVAFELAREGGDGYVVAQRYLPEAEEGEKRLVWLDGTLIGGYLRRRAPGEFRHNLKRGGLAQATTIEPADHELSAQITPHLLHAGVRLAGLDVIGGHLIEVNVLNPGGAYHTDRLTGSHLGAMIVERLTGRSEELISQWAVPAP